MSIVRIGRRAGNGSSVCQCETRCCSKVSMTKRISVLNICVCVYVSWRSVFGRINASVLNGVGFSLKRTPLRDKKKPPRRCARAHV